MGRTVERLVEVGQELVDAACDGFVAFDFPIPALGSCLVGEGEFGCVAVPEPWRVLRRGDELRAGEEQVALAGSFGG